MLNIITMKSILSFLLCMLFLSFSYAQEPLSLEIGFFNTFEGTIDGKNIRMSLWPKQDSTIVGQYCNLNNQKVQLEGRFSKSKIALNEITNGEVTSHFLGVFSEHYDGDNYQGSFYEGTWQNASKTVPFKLGRIGYHNGKGSFDKNYPFFMEQLMRLTIFYLNLKKAY